MNVFGVGAWELVAILLIMLVFAGPKRMIHWSYVLGKHVAKFRKIWSETVDLVQKEFDDAGLDIKLPKEPPTRKGLNKSLTEAVKPMTKPLEDSVAEVKGDMDVFKDVSDSLNEKQPKTAANGSAAKTKSSAPKVKLPAKPAKPKPKPAIAPMTQTEPAAMGSWGGGPPASASDASNANGSAVDLGAWSKAAEGD